MLSQAVDDRVLPAKPARFGDEQPAEIQPLTAMEVHEFLQAVKQRMAGFYAFFMCAFRTGLRLATAHAGVG